jgi:hypothetical protein
MGVLEKYKRKTGKMREKKKGKEAMCYLVTVVYIFDMNFELVI